ncbi:MAG: hypothetical protein R3E95_12740 [Thiolinea sp.]
MNWPPPFVTPQPCYNSWTCPHKIASPEATRQFRLLVPHSYLQRIRPGDPHVRCCVRCCRWMRNCVRQPVFNSTQSAIIRPVGPGVLHKYQGRVLLVATGSCAVCRYCFRRHYYADENPGRQDWQAALDYLRAHPGVQE